MNFSTGLDRKESKRKTGDEKRMGRKLRPIEWIAVAISIVLIVLIGIKAWQLAQIRLVSSRTYFIQSFNITFGSDSAQALPFTHT